MKRNFSDAPPTACEPSTYVESTGLVQPVVVVNTGEVLGRVGIVPAAALCADSTILSLREALNKQRMTDLRCEGRVVGKARQRLIEGVLYIHPTDSASHTQLTCSVHGLPRCSNVQ